MYLHQAMSQMRSKVPTINRIGAMNQVNRKLLGAQSGLKRIGNIASQGRQYGAYINNALGGAMEKNETYNKGMSVLGSLEKLK
jgi:hypothetical protein